MDYLKLNGQVVNYKTRSKYETNKETKKTTNGFTKSYYEEKEEKESEEIMPYGTGSYGSSRGRPMKKKKKKKKKKR